MANEVVNFRSTQNERIQVKGVTVRERGSIALAVLAVVGMIVLAFAIFGASLGIRYLTAGPKGAVGAKEAQQSSLNRVQQQAKFEQLVADYDGYLVQIQIAEDSLKSASPATRAQRETEVVGLRQICVNTAQNFNAESRKYVARVWKSAGLPLTLNPLLCQGG